MMRRFLATMTAAAIIVSAIEVHAAPAGLSDMQGHWARPQVEAGLQAGYVAGYPDGTFRPQAPVTRAEFFKLLGGAMRLAPSHVVTGFAEQSAAHHWAFVQGHLPAAVSSGLIYPPDYGAEFSPNMPITRREMVLASVRALGLEAEATRPGHQLQTPDAALYAPWLHGFANVALARGVITGYEDHSLGLERTATRAEALVMVQRILDRVSMDLTPGAAPGGRVRHPGEGEPAWTVSASTGEQVTITDGSKPYTFTQSISAVVLLPAPGKAAWVAYSVGKTGVVARLFEGQLTEVARLEEQTPRLLVVDDAGRLWYTDGETQLMTAYKNGEVQEVAGVDQPLQFGAIDWDGRFWGLGSSHLFRVSAEGAITLFVPDLPADQLVQHMSMADDGSVWLILGGTRRATEPKAEAIQLRDGRTERRIPLLGPYFGGLGVELTVSVVGRSGPFLWLSPRVGLAQQAHGLYRLNMENGAFSRMIPPRSVAADLVPVSAPEGGVLLQDKAGAFWRLLPTR